MSLPEIIKSLLDASAYPGNPGHVEMRQTHVSYLFFTPSFVYKVKKPVDFGFLDFTTLERRLHFCNEEVRLNRRLAPGVYLGVAGVTIEDGRTRMEGRGAAVEYAVKMRRLPDDAMLSEMVKRGSADEKTVERIAGVIADFHRTAEGGGYISEYGRPEAIKKNADENFSQTEDFIGGVISRPLYETIRSYTDGFIGAHAELFNKRIEQGFIRDCHGDLHADHVYTDDGIHIIDCIEFNGRFRFSDTASDIAFLSMDLDHMNRNDLARALEEAYFLSFDDRDGARLIDFYKCYRAYVRGKVEGLKFLEKEVAGEEKTEAYYSARRHFHLAGLYAKGGWAPSIAVIRGLSGTGKSTLAAAIANASGMVRLSSDAVRKELAGLPPAQSAASAFREGIYSDEFTERTYREMIERAAFHMANGRSVILDATFSKKRHLEELRNAVKSIGMKAPPMHVIECRADEATVRTFFEKRAKEAPGGVVSDAGWEIHLRQRDGFEDIGGRSLVIDMSGPFDGALHKAMDEIFG